MVIAAFYTLDRGAKVWADYFARGITTATWQLDWTISHPNGYLDKITRNFTVVHGVYRSSWGILKLLSKVPALLHLDLKPRIDINDVPLLRIPLIGHLYNNNNRENQTYHPPSLR